MQYYKIYEKPKEWGQDTHLPYNLSFSALLCCWDLYCERSDIFLCHKGLIKKTIFKKVPFVINMFDKSLYLINLIKTAFQIPSFIFVTLLH